MDRVVIIGGRGTAVVIAEQILDAIDRFGMKLELLGYAFDDETLGGEVNGVPIICKTYEAWPRFRQYNDVFFVYQLYRPDLIRERIQLLQSFEIPMSRMYTFVHPSCYVARSAHVGRGTAVCANSVVNPNARIGDCVTLNSAVLIGHDAVIGDYSFLAGHTAIGSNTVIGKGNFIGLNSAVRNFISLGDFNIIGAASNVVKELGDAQVVYGNPATVRTGLGGAVR